MKRKVSVTDGSIQSAGLTKNYMEAVAEYIWNGFDAAATDIDILFEANELGHIHQVSIRDNGTGIDPHTLSETFGNFNDSVKKATFQKSSSSVMGNKGRGRFSFVAFSGRASWTTVFRDEKAKKCQRYDITITKGAKDFYEDKNQADLPAVSPTGTTVTFSELFDVTGHSFEAPEFASYLAREFGWFLLLNHEKDYTIRVNGTPVDYSPIINEQDVRTWAINDAEGQTSIFKITFVRWNERIGDRFYFYFLNSHQKETFKELTSFNNNAIEFNHSLYVESRYFDKFNPFDKEASANAFENTRHHSVFKTLMKQLHAFLSAKEKEFVNGEAASKLIENYERTGVIPAFEDGKAEQARRQDLLGVVKSLYCIEPKLFKGLNKEQQKISVGLIHLLLGTDKRELMLPLLTDIITLSDEDRELLNAVLQKAAVSAR